MFVITCPCCGATAEETEFAYGGQAHIVRAGPDSSDDEYREYLFERPNPRGPHLERWRHSFGCGKWFHMARDTMSLEIYGVYGIREKHPPAEIQARIDAAQGAR